jgi:hypothetical protein
MALNQKVFDDLSVAHRRPFLPRIGLFSAIENAPVVRQLFIVRKTFRVSGGLLA